MLDEALQRVGTAIEHEIVAQLALGGTEFGVRRDLFGVDDRHVEPGGDAVVQHHASSAPRAPAGLRPNDTLETPSEVSTPGSRALIARMPSIVSSAERVNSGVAGR